MGLFNMFMRNDSPVPPNSESNADVKYLEKILRKWLESKERDEQLLAEKYYDGHHDILERKRMVVNAEGTLTPVYNMPNNKVVNNQYRKLVDQKTNYTLGKPLSITTQKDQYLVELNKVFNKRVHRQLRVLTQNAVNGGIAWLYPYYSETGEFKFAIYPAHEICPIWLDKAHTELEAVIRYYPEEVFTNDGGTTTIYHADLFTKDGITHFLYQSSSLIRAEHPHSAYVKIGDKEYNWDRLPMIPFKYNAKEVPLIRNVKGLQDALNLAMSDFQNQMEEDPRTSILVLKNYDGTNIPEFRQNLATYGVIKVTTVDGVQGGVEVLKVDVDATNYQAQLMQIKRAIIENGYGFDAKEERMDGDPNQMNIESMYTDIDLDVNAMETEFQAGFEELKWFVDRHIERLTGTDYSDESVEFVFNRDIFINEDAKIDNCVKSVGIISNETILSRHPWINDVKREMSQIEEDKQQDLEEMEATQALTAKYHDTGGSRGGVE